MQHIIVAGNLPLQIDAACDPTNQWVRCKQRLDDTLHNQCAIIAARHVRRLVKADLV
jgi:hypothetical protein